MVLNRCLTIEDLFFRKNDRFFYQLENYDERFKNANFKDFKLLYKKEISLTTETEYAQKYSNNPNGLHIYILEW